MQESASNSYKARWEQAISEVDEYFTTNTKNAEALRGRGTTESSGKEREVDEVQVALPGTAITLEEEIERFNDKVKTHLHSSNVESLYLALY